MFTKTIIPCVLLVVACLTLMPSCKKDRKSITDTPQPAAPLTEQETLDKVLTLPPTALNYTHFDLPFYLNTAGMNSFDNTPASNLITDDGATLGRVLFYDKLLSANNTTACASCHKQANSFADPNQFSTGFTNVKTSRNAMSLANAKYYQLGSFFWDQRAATLEELVLQPIQNKVEMGLTLDELESRLARQDHYKILFRRAFGDTIITRDKVSLALSQFVRSMVSFQSRFDEGKAAPPTQNGDFVNFTAQENNGMRLFGGLCARCHGTPVHVGHEALNNGLDLVYTDNGLGDITKNATDNGKFKTPSLRNIAVTAPYMHDGRFADLAKVIEHYNNGVKNHPNLAPSMRTFGPDGQPKRLNLTQTQQDEIIAFLNTLTDNRFLTDTKYSNPFRK